NHLERTLAVACADLVRLPVEVEGIADLAGSNHLQGTRLKSVEALEGSGGIEVAAKRVEGAEQVLPVFQSASADVAASSQVVQRLLVVSTAHAERLVFNAEVIGAFPVCPVVQADVGRNSRSAAADPADDRTQRRPLCLIRHGGSRGVLPGIAAVKL